MSLFFISVEFASSPRPRPSSEPTSQIRLARSTTPVKIRFYSFIPIVSNFVPNREFSLFVLIYTNAYQIINHAYTHRRLARDPPVQPTHHRHHPQNTHTSTLCTAAGNPPAGTYHIQLVSKTLFKHVYAMSLYI